MTWLRFDYADRRAYRESYFNFKNIFVISNSSQVVPVVATIVDRSHPIQC